MQRVTLIEVEVDGVKVDAKVELDELSERFMECDLVTENKDEILRSMHDWDIEDEASARGLVFDINKYVALDEIEYALHQIYIEKACGREYDDLLNSLLREYIGREL
tara:strand:+ start:691 stop:1011 length:321 start_codon:yes stop_codon:yes gene_type:complete